MMPRSPSRRRAAAATLAALLTASCTGVNTRAEEGAAEAPEPAVSATSTSAPFLAPSPIVLGGVERVEIVGRSDVVTGLTTPWAMAFAPDGSLLVTERDSRRILRVVDGQANALAGDGAAALAALGDVAGEGGLLGIALLPSDPSVVYVYVTLATENAVWRMTLTGDELSAPLTVFAGIPSARNHDGGRIAFGPDGFLYIATGDAGQRELAQDQASLAGKILRVVAEGGVHDGEPAPGNPWGTAVWSWGHRNVQGLAWLADGRMFASELGQNDADELNLIEAGANYGWPLVESLIGAPAGTTLGDTVNGLTYPVAEWRPTGAASPSGIAATHEAVYVATLRGTTLYRVPLTEGGYGAPQVILADLGRLRDVVVGPDGALYVATHNTDGKGSPAPGDDRIVRIELKPAD